MKKAVVSVTCISVTVGLCIGTFFLGMRVGSRIAFSMQPSLFEKAVAEGKMKQVFLELLDRGDTAKLRRMLFLSQRSDLLIIENLMDDGLNDSLKEKGRDLLQWVKEDEETGTSCNDRQEKLATSPE